MPVYIYTYIFIFIFIYLYIYVWRCDALLPSTPAACSPWQRAPRFSTPWRYPAPKERCVQGGAAVRVGPTRVVASVGGRGAGGPLRRAWLCRLCAGGRRRGAHGRWGPHVQGRHDLEHQGGARANPLRFHVVRRIFQMLALCAACCTRWCTCDVVHMPRGEDVTSYESRCKLGYVMCCTWRNEPRRWHARCGAAFVWRMVREEWEGVEGRRRRGVWCTECIACRQSERV
jgi:hypothetical protein